MKNTNKNDMENTAAKFELGQTYNMTFIGDSNLKVPYKCVKLTAKTATFTSPKNGETITRRIKKGYYDGVEYVLEGSYSMAPCISADKKI